MSDRRRQAYHPSTPVRKAKKTTFREIEDEMRGSSGRLVRTAFGWGFDYAVKCKHCQTKISRLAAGKSRARGSRSGSYVCKDVKECRRRRRKAKAKA